MAVAVHDAAITEQAKRVQEDGFTIVEGAANPALTATGREALRSLANQLGVEPKAIAAEASPPSAGTTCWPKSRSWPWR